MDGRLALSQAINNGLSSFTTLSVFMDYAGKCGAAVVSGTERHDQRLSFQVQWLEACPYAKLSSRIQKAFKSLESAGVKDATFLVEMTRVGAPGLNTLAAEVGYYPLSAGVSGETTDVEAEPMRLCLTDMMGALQSAAAANRLEIPEALERGDALIATIKGVETVDGKMLGVDDPCLRAVALGVWYCQLSLGDQGVGAPPPITDLKELELQAEAERQEASRDFHGGTWEDF